MKLKFASFLFFFLIFFFGSAFVTQVAYANNPLTITNMDFDPSTGAYSFDYSPSGAQPDHQVTLRSGIAANHFNFDDNGNYSCTSSHCSGTYNGDRSAFSCNFDNDGYFVLINNGQQWDSQSMSALEFSSTCSPRPQVTMPAEGNISEGDIYDGNGSFTDTNTNATAWVATVDYGDGSGSQPLTLDGMNFSLSHQYINAGNYTITVVVTDDQAMSGTGTLHVFVSEPCLGALFCDAFNGNGELHQYNNAYELLSDFHNNTGTLGLFTDHLQTTGYDPAYVYTAIPGDNVCASIDFNWSNTYYPIGVWTDIILHSTPDSFGAAFQVRSDDAEHQRWTFYNGSGAAFIYESGPVVIDGTSNHTLKACIAGSTIFGYLDGVHIFTGSNTFYNTQGYVGFGSQESTYYLDNFKIEEFTAPSITPTPTPTPVTAVFNASADTYIGSGQTDRNQGGEVSMRVRSSGNNRSLVRFDQQALGSTIGSGAAILSAKLRLTITDNGNNWGITGRTVAMHRLTANWAEGNGTETDRGSGVGATWNCAIDSLIENQAKNCSGITAWEMGQPTNPLVHPWVAVPTDTKTITNNQIGVVEYDVTPDVQSFLNGTGNYGWLIKKTEEGQNGSVEFGTKESASVPQLVVTYQP